MSQNWDVLVAGAGVAGCAAAAAARRAGAGAVLLVDPAERPGGALASMGLHHEADDDTLARAGVAQSYRTALLEIAAGLHIRLLSPGGTWRGKVRALVLATGGREETRGNLALPGTRPAGVLTAGGALRLLAATGRRPGKRAVIAGRGRWAKVVARALERAGARILAIVPAVASIEGWPRITAVVLEDGRRQECDLLVLATGLLPWLPPALAHAAELPGVFVAGCAALGELDEHEAAEAGAEVGREAAAYAARCEF